MNQLSTAKRVQVIAALVEGNSIRSTERMSGVAKNTVLRLLTEIGKACADFQDICLTDLPAVVSNVMRSDPSVMRKRRTCLTS
jgi:uncharacterized protein YycO